MEKKSVLCTLLEKIGKQLRDISDDTEPVVSYNILSVLGIENKEVLICRLLGDFLDPSGAHGMGSVPLKIFSTKSGEKVANSGGTSLGYELGYEFECLPGYLFF